VRLVTKKRLPDLRALGSGGRYVDEERRMARHEARMKGERPKNEPVQKWEKEVLEHPLLTDLRTFLGMLSDHYAHFSPEFEGNLA
jgi:siderophore synthetase component